MSNGKVNLLWTGGWDSTFRLLQLCHDTEATIQPHYLVDEERASTPREMQVMEEIRRKLRQDLPGLNDRLLPTRFGDYRGTQIEPHIDEKWKRLNEEWGHLGFQYPVLASYAEQNDIDKMELSVEARANSHSSIHSILESDVETHTSPIGPVPSVKEDVNGPVSLLNRFTFPIMDYTKSDIREEAMSRGWMPIMEKTWFCFNPALGYPCGFCRPCRIALKENMGDRVGNLGRLISPFIYPRKRAVAWLKRIGAASQVKSILQRIRF